MGEPEIIVTLIGTKLAKVGNEFIFKGAVKECEACKFNKTCLALNIGSKYRITSLRNGGKLECTVHDSGVCAVEVVEEPILVGLESRKAIKGSKVVYEPQACNLSDCANFIICHPSGIRRGDKFTIVDVIGEISEPCEKGYPLKIVKVKR